MGNHFIWDKKRNKRATLEFKTDKNLKYPEPKVEIGSREDSASQNDLIENKTEIINGECDG